MGELQTVMGTNVKNPSPSRSEVRPRASAAAAPFPGTAAKETVFEYRIFKEVEALLQDRCSRQEGEIKKLREREEILSGHCASLGTRHKALVESELPAIKTREKELEVHCAKLQARCAQLDADHATERAHFAERIQSLEGNLLALAGELSSTRERERESGEQLALFEKMLGAERSRAEASLSALENSKLARAALEKTNASLTREIESIRAEAVNTAERAESLGAMLSVERDRADAATAASAGLGLELEQKRDQVAKSTERAESLERALAAERARTDRMAVALENSDREVQGSAIRIAELTSDDRAMRVRYDELRNEFERAAATQSLLDARELKVSRRELRLESYRTLVNERAEEVRTVSLRMAEEIRSAMSLHPLRDTLAYSDLELSRLESELYRVPASFEGRAELEAASRRLREQRDFLKSTIAASLDSMDARANELLEVSAKETLEATPPLFRPLPPQFHPLRRRSPKP